MPKMCLQPGIGSIVSSGQSSHSRDVAGGAYNAYTLSPDTQAYSYVTVYCMNFILCLCVTLKSFSLSFMPLLATNPGDATVTALK